MKIEVKNPNNLPTIKYSVLEDLQGDLKSITQENLEKLKNSIKNYGFFVPCFVWIKDKYYYMLDAHQRYKACISLESEGYKIPPIPYIEIQAENKKDAGEKLLQINSRYGTINPDTSFFRDFDIDLSFINEIEIPELDIDNLMPDYEGQSDEDAIPEEVEPICKTGDLWLLGEHRLLCGDSTKKEDVERLMDGEKADMVFCDPPYGIDLDTDFTQLNSKLKFVQEKHLKQKTGNRYDKVIGDKIDFEPQFLLDLFGYCKEIFLWGGDYYSKKLPDNGSLFVWDKRGGEQFDKMYGSTFEICWSKNKHRREIIRHIWAGVFGTEKEDIRGRVHPTQKPVGVCEWFIKKFSKRGQNIIDLFGGSGSTLIACERLNRKCFMMEISKHYCDVILQRYFAYTGKDPIRKDGIKFSKLKNGTKNL